MKKAYWVWSINGDANICRYVEGEQPKNSILYNGENFFKPLHINGKIIEGITEEEINKIKINQAIEIDLEYTEKITQLLKKHNDKYIQGLILGIPYIFPQDVLEERDKLKQECNDKIAELGITDYTYRQTNLIIK